jgi:hypothetical protein
MSEAKSKAGAAQTRQFLLFFALLFGGLKKTL